MTQKLRANALTVQDRLHKKLADGLFFDTDHSLDHAVIIDVDAVQQGRVLLIAFHEMRDLQLLEVIEVTAEDGIEIKTVVEDFDLGQTADILPAGFADVRIHGDSPFVAGNMQTV